MTIQELKNLSERDFVARIWGNNVLEAIAYYPHDY